MIYLYHSAPKNLQGNILYPLNALKEKHPDIYEYFMDVGSHTLYK